MALGKISVDLDELLGGEDFDIREAIIRRSVSEMSRQITDEVRESIKERIHCQVADHIDAKLEEIFLASLRPTDSWGNPREGGKSKTLAELVLDQVKDHLTEKVDTSGNSGPASYSSKRQTRAQWIVREIAREFVEKQFKEDVRQAQEAVRSQIGDGLTKAFKQALAECVKL